MISYNTEYCSTVAPPIVNRCYTDRGGSAMSHARRTSIWVGKAGNRRILAGSRKDSMLKKGVRLVSGLTKAIPRNDPEGAVIDCMDPGESRVGREEFYIYLYKAQWGEGATRRGDNKGFFLGLGSCYDSRRAGASAPGRLKHLNYLQSKMARKDREKAKRLFSPAVKEQGFKMARTEESEGEVDETRQDPLLNDLYDNMEIPTTPPRTEREMASIDMMVDSPLTLREEGEIGKGEDPVMEGNVEHSKQESALVKGERMTRGKE